MTTRAEFTGEAAGAVFESAPRGLEEQVMRMFALTDEVLAGEAEREARISELGIEFLRADGVCAETNLAALSERFKASELPETPADPTRYMDYLAEHVIPDSINTASPRFIGHMTTALPHFVRPLGKLLTTLNQNQVKLETSKSLSFCERQTLAMIHRLVFDRPEEFYQQHAQHRDSTLGVVASGGTLANITALWCAYNAALGPTADFKGVAEAGLPAALAARGHAGAVVIGSSLMHYSLEKAVSLLGLGTDNLIKVAVDSQQRVDLSALREAVANCRARNQLIIAVVGTAGTTESGAVDPLAEMAEVARGAGAHFHVDAAWGGALLFSRRHRHKLRGVESADSVTLDGHKQLYLPMGVGMVLLRRPHLAKVIERHARYIVRPTSIDLGKRTLEGSRPATVMFLHAALHLIGRRGYEFLIDESIRKTRYMVEAVGARAEFELLNEPQMNILNYRVIPARLRERAARGRLDDSDNQDLNEFNVRLQRLQRQAGKTFVSRTSLETTRHGLPVAALRVVLANPRTTEADIDAVLKDQLAIAASMN